MKSIKPLTIQYSQGYVPSISLDPQQGQLRFEGQCMMKHIWQISIPTMKWVDQYLSSCPTEVKICINMYHLNAAMAKLFWELFHVLEDYCATTANQVILYWSFDAQNAEMRQWFEDCQKEIKLPCVCQELDTLH